MLKNKKGLVFGIANNHSIAWGIAKQLAENGAEIAISYQNEILLKRVKPLSEEINSKILIECDFNNDNSINKSVEIIKKETDDNRSYHISSEKIKERLGFEAKSRIRHAVTDLVKAFETGKLQNTFNDEKYFNIKRMQSLNLN